MDDQRRPTPDEARDWLVNHGEAPDIGWSVARDHDPGRVHKLLEFLFTPQVDDDAA